MENKQHPTYGNGKICYIEIPAVNIENSVDFYQSVFGWNIRKRGDGAIAFDDAVGEVSGAWVTGRKPSAEAGVLVYIMVDDIKDAVEKVEANGGIIVQQIGVDTPELTARFTDPAGNIFGLYQEPVK